MVVQHNMQAMNANRMLNITTGSQAKSTEKLSSGYRINRAADDAAGLTISEKMRKQMRGLDRASTNAEDGVSAVQTAEGALTEVHSMLQRLNELANQASNGSNSKSDRDAIQAEIEQLTTEIDRVAETTKFNETYLLKGNSEGTSSEVKVAAHDAGLAGKLVDNEDGTATFTLKDKLEAGSTITIANENYTIGEKKTTSDYDTLTNVSALTLQVGDSVTKADGTKFAVSGNATSEDVRKFLSTKTGTSPAATVSLGTLTLADGTSYEFKGAGSATKLTVVKTTADGKQSTGDSQTLAGTGAGADTFLKLTNETSLNLEGATFTTSGGANTFTLVSSLNRDELTLFDVATGAQAAATDVDTILTLSNTAGNTAAGTALAVGDTVTRTTTDASGNKTETTKTAYNATTAGGGVKTTDELADVLNKLAVSKQVTVTDYAGNNSVTYIIAGSKDAENGNTLTVDSIINKLKEGDIVDADGETGSTAGKTYSVAGVDSEEGTISVNDAYKKIAEELKTASSIGADEGKAAAVLSNGDGSFSITQGSVEVADKLSFSLHVGADADMTNKIGVDIDSMSAAGLGIKGINVSDDSGVAATYAIDAISDAIAKVSEQRSALGAVQNRLEHTIANLDNVVENTTSAESRIRDTDMASEMVEFSKNNILAQAGQSMLAQANQSNQGVLSLLG